MQKMEERLKNLILNGFFLLFGITTGRTLPQWEDVYGVFGYSIFLLFGIGLIWITYKYNDKIKFEINTRKNSKTNKENKQ